VFGAYSIQFTNRKNHITSIVYLNSLTHMHACVCTHTHTHTPIHTHTQVYNIVILQNDKIQGGSNMTGTDLCVNKPHCAAAVRP